MQYVAVSVAALIASTLSFFSGFGLGTLLLPAFALFFPVPVAVAATGVVHLASNLFKAALVGRRASVPVLVRFAVPAAIGALVGARLLERVAAAPPLLVYTLGGSQHEVTPVKLTIALLMVAFAALELHPRLARLSFDRRWLMLGGFISGFFGGLSGHQGALRSAFLARVGLDKEAFVATAAMSAVVVDVTRLTAYAAMFHAARFGELDPGLAGLVLAATLAAFAGSLAGMRLLPGVTVRAIQLVLGGMLLGTAVGLGAGLL